MGTDGLSPKDIDLGFGQGHGMVHMPVPEDCL